MCAAHLTRAQHDWVRRRRSEGATLQEIARDLGCNHNTVWMVAKGVRKREPRDVPVWDAGPGRLSLAEREEIRAGLGRGESMSAIARRLGRAPSTVTREVARAGGRHGYQAWRAHHLAFEAARRPKVVKLACPRLAGQVAQWLEELWSPEEIAKRLRMEFPDDPMMWVSHETIYKSLFVQGRGELRRELHRCLRTGRARRRPQGRLEKRGTIPGMVMISERPADVADRAVPGHWEGDLIFGKGNRSAVGTLVERATRYVLLLHLPDGHEADVVEAAMRRAIASLPAELFRTVTWDQGKEMARHARFTVDTGIQIYFCDPASPWQRGSNENTNGLLRQYMPKGSDLSLLSPDDLATIARSLNNRPRKTLGFLKPSEKLAEFLAMTG